jgi:hypothetical protein
VVEPQAYHSPDLLSCVNLVPSYMCLTRCHMPPPPSLPSPPPPAGAETLLAMASVVEHEPCSVRCSSDFIAGTTPTKRPARCLPEMRLSDGLSPSPFKKPRGGRLSGSGGLMAWSAARPARGGRPFDRDAGGQTGVDQDADMCDLGSEGCQDCGGLEGDIVSPRGGLDQQVAPGFGGPGVGGGTEASHASGSNLTGAGPGAAGSSLFLSPPRQMVPRWASLDSTPSKPPLGEGLLSSGGRGGEHLGLAPSFCPAFTTVPFP